MTEIVRYKIREDAKLDPIQQQHAHTQFSTLLCSTPGCNCQFSTEHDLACHMTVCPKKPEWKPSQFDAGEILSSDDDVRLRIAVRNAGSLIVGGMKVTLSQDGKWLKRRPI